MKYVKTDKKIGLALGGGGARGLAHIGVLKVLEKAKIKVDFLTGVSMGALIGAYYVLGMDLKKLEDEAVQLTKRKAVRELLDLANPKKSLLKGRKTACFIEKHIGQARFSDAKIPFSVIATDLATGEEVIIDRGEILPALMASISVPGIFPPVQIGDKYLIDGGVVNCTPVDRLEKMGADIVIGVDLIIKREIKLDNPGMVATLMQAYEIIRAQGVKNNINKLNKEAIIIKPKLRGTIDSFKFYDIDKFIKSGEKAAKEALPDILKKIK